MYTVPTILLRFYYIGTALDPATVMLANEGDLYSMHVEGTYDLTLRQISDRLLTATPKDGLRPVGPHNFKKHCFLIRMRFVKVP